VGKNWRLADEVRYIQRRAALHDGRLVSVGPLALFPTDSGDAWLLDPSEQLAVRLARDGEPEPVYIEETTTNFALPGPGITASTAQPSYTATESPIEFSPSLATPPTRSVNCVD